MLSSLPDPPEIFEPPEPPRSPWTFADLVVFGFLFAVTVLFLPLGMFFVMQTFRPGLQLADLTAVDQVVMSAAADIALVGCIMFLVKVVHGRSFRETIHWRRDYAFSTGSLISLGITLAITVLIVSSLFPPVDTPIEKMLSTMKSLYVFVIFGVALAPLFEEIIFRGFLFKVFTDLGGPSVAIPLTSVLFALLHAQQLWGSWAGIALIFCVGFVLSVIRQRTNSVIPSLIVHVSYNAMLFGVYALSTLVQKSPVPK